MIYLVVCQGPLRIVSFVSLANFFSGERRGETGLMSCLLYRVGMSYAERGRSRLYILLLPCLPISYVCVWVETTCCNA